jgi:2-C-methyl-D-erythritol 4-phosphate cytidylyltransferase
VRLGTVCVAAGSGRRFGGDKLAARLGGRMVLEIAVDALVAAHPGLPLVVVAAGDRLDLWRDRLGPAFPGSLWLAGGERRQDSVRAGVEAAAGLGCDTVCVHDAARPLVRVEDVRAVVAALGDGDGAILCQAVTDTVKRVDAKGVVLSTLPREEMRLALTPQVFRVAALQSAWGRLGGSGEWTDEAALLEAAGLAVQTVVARWPNPKLTSPEDLPLLRALSDSLDRSVTAGAGR